MSPIKLFITKESYLVFPKARKFRFHESNIFSIVDFLGDFHHEPWD